jgi:hypothetical protein
VWQALDAEGHVSPPGAEDVESDRVLIIDAAGHPDLHPHRQAGRRYRAPRAADERHPDRGRRYPQRRGVVRMETLSVMRHLAFLQRPVQRSTGLAAPASDLIAQIDEHVERGGQRPKEPAQTKHFCASRRG